MRCQFRSLGVCWGTALHSYTRRVKFRGKPRVLGFQFSSDFLFLLYFQGVTWKPALRGVKLRWKRSKTCLKQGQWWQRRGWESRHAQVGLRMNKWRADTNPQQWLLCGWECQGYQISYLPNEEGGAQERRECGVRRQPTGIIQSWIQSVRYLWDFVL